MRGFPPAGPSQVRRRLPKHPRFAWSGRGVCTPTRPQTRGPRAPASWPGSLSETRALRLVTAPRKWATEVGPAGSAAVARDDAEARGDAETRGPHSETPAWAGRGHAALVLSLVSGPHPEPSQKPPVDLAHPRSPGSDCRGPRFRESDSQVRNWEWGVFGATCGQAGAISSREGRCLLFQNHTVPCL